MSITRSRSRSRRPRARAALATLLVAAAACALAPAAHADSIAYIKDGNVWLSTGDGSRQFQVTSRGGYSDVSQADDGVLIALTGVRLQKLDRLGNVLADFDTPVSDTRPAGSRTFYGPYDPAISPDGTKVAYDWYYLTQSQTNTCYPPQCVTAINEGGTGYTHSDRQTAWDEAGFAQHSGWRNPSWVDDATTVLSDPTHLPNDDVVVDVPSGRGQSGFLVKGWFSDSVGGNPHTSGGEVTRDRRKAAFVTGEGDATLTLYRVGSFPTTFRDGEAPAETRPEVCYRYSHPVGGSFGTPSFSPDGSRLAFAVGDGVAVVTVPDFAGGCTTNGASPSSTLLIPGATQPDWGPADVPTGRAAGGSASGGGAVGGSAGGGGGTAAGGGTHTGTTGGGAAGGARMSVTPVRLSSALARGLTVRVTGAAAGRTIRLSARTGGRTVATGSARADAKGRATVRLRFSRAQARRLKRAPSVRLMLTGAGRAVTVTLRR